MGLRQGRCPRDPDLWGGLIDLPPEPARGEALAVLAELSRPDAEDQVALRGNARFVARLVRRREAAHRSARLRADCTYLITGGLGALGLSSAQWMVRRGARHLALMGRSGASPAAREAIGELERSGAEISVVKADVSREVDVVRALEGIAAAGPPLGGVIYAAGTLEDGIVANQEWAHFTKVMAPKVTGAWNLHRLTVDLPLDFFVTFSSVASVLGSPGQANYAAASAFLDVLAHERRAKGLPGLSINWGPWAESGMAASVDQRHRERLEAMGVDPLTPAQGLHALERLIGQSRPEICVFPVDWRVFARQLPARARTPLLSELLEPGDLESGAGPAAPDQPELQLRLSKALPRERWNLLLKFLQTEVAHVLGLPASRPPEPQDGFFDIGMDSLMAVELKNRLETSLGRTLPVTALFNYSTIDALASYLYREILSTEISGEPAPSADPDESKLAAELEGLSESDVAELIAEEVEAYRQELRHG